MCASSSQKSTSRAELGLTRCNSSPKCYVFSKQARSRQNGAEQAHRRTEERRSRSESALRRKAKLKAESAMFAEMQEGAKDVRASADSSGTEAG